MRDKEAKMEAQIEEFVAAAQDLHESGTEWFRMPDVSKQMARNDEALMRRRKIAGKILGVVGIKLSEPEKESGGLYPVATRLEGQGVLKSTWEAAGLEAPGHPTRRLYRLVEEPVAQAV